MNKLIVAAAICVVSGAVFADGYVGLSRSKGRMDYKCNDGLNCKKNAELLKFYAGAKIDARDQIDLVGVAKVEAVELAYWRGIKPSAAGLVKEAYFTDADGYILPSNPINNNYVSNRYSIGFDALILAGVVRGVLLDDLSAVAKFGTAYVTATKRYEHAGVSSKSSTASKFKPYLGLGLDYNLGAGFSLTGTFDYSMYEVDGTKGSISSFGVGAEYVY